MELNVSRRYLFGMFAMLYFVQGVIQAYQLNFFKPHMDSEGIDADRLAIVASLALLPFVLKFIYGIISDRFSLFGRGHRKPYMQIGLIAAGVAFFVAYFIDPSESFGVLATMVLTATFFMALFDTTADALAKSAIAAIYDLSTEKRPSGPEFEELRAWFAEHLHARGKKVDSGE